MAASKLGAPRWAAPFALGCAAGLLAGALLSAASARRRAGAAAVEAAGKRKAQRFAKRGALQGGPAGAEAPSDGAARPGREVLCEDAVAWLEQLPPRGLPPGSCVVTGIPDIQEVDPEGRMGLDGWKAWFQRSVELILQRLPEGGIAVFMQTDVKVPRDRAHLRKSSDGCYWEWVDKAQLVLLAAASVPGARLVWHKIVFGGSTEAVGRSSSVAGYSHVLCFAVGDEPESFTGAPFPDVSRKGISTWAAGSGVQATERICEYVRTRGRTLVVDPFCGEGAVLAVANALGLASMGVELCKRRARLAAKLDGALLLEADRAERAEGCGGKKPRAPESDGKPRAVPAGKKPKANRGQADADADADGGKKAKAGREGGKRAKAGHGRADGTADGGADGGAAEEPGAAALGPASA